MNPKSAREQKLRARIAALEERAQKAACPIYGAAFKKGCLVGSGFLLAIDEVTLLVTAAHVLEEKRHHVLHLPANGWTVPF